MKKIYRKLKKNQIKAGIVFSSCLSLETTEQPGDTIHHVKGNDKDKEATIKRLKDDSFFDRSPYYCFNIIRN